MNQIKVLSQTYALDLTTSASSALQIVPNTSTRAFRVAILNTGSGIAAAFHAACREWLHRTIALRHHGEILNVRRASTGAGLPH